MLGAVTADDPGSYPLFLTKLWFPPTNAGVLRTHLRWLILDLFIAQAQNPELPAVHEAILERDDIKAVALRCASPLLCRTGFRV